MMVEGAEAGGVELLAEDPVTFTQIHIIDHVTTHQIGVRKFGRVTMKPG